MLEESGCNVVSLGIFSWSTLEPEEGVFHFAWLKEIIDQLYQRGISHVFLATPSGARPKWMAEKYPEALRADVDQTQTVVWFSAQSLLYFFGIQRKSTYHQQKTGAGSGGTSGRDSVAYFQ